MEENLAQHQGRFERVDAQNIERVQHWGIKLGYAYCSVGVALVTAYGLPNCVSRLMLILNIQILSIEINLKNVHR